MPDIDQDRIPDFVLEIPVEVGDQMMLRVYKNFTNIKKRDQKECYPVSRNNSITCSPDYKILKKGN